MTTDAKQPLYAWFVVAMLWFVLLLNYLDRVMITTMRESLTEAIPMTDAQFGLLTSAFLWVYGILSPFAGFLSDRFSRSRVILVSLFCWSLLTWLTGHARTFEEMLLARALMGLSEAAYIPAALALIADYHRGNTRSLATGVHMTGVCVGSGMGGLGGWIAERQGWSYAFVLFGVIGILYAVCLVFLLRDPPRENHPAAGSSVAKSKVGFVEAMRSLFGCGAFLLMVVYWGVLGMVGWVIVGWMPTYFGERFHLTQSAAGFYATSFLQAAMLVGLFLGGGLADLWNRTNPRARILVPAIGLCAAAPGIFLVSQTNLLVVAIVGLMLYGLARASVDANMMPALCLVCDPRYRATGYGVLNLFSCIVGGLGVYAGGALRDAEVNINVLLLGAAASMLACAILMFLVKLPPHPAG